ncbi:hypothetical protein BC938DRAFT_476925 [Jimgerdemannia flammicorona]|uniref:RNA ligase 2 C-terminal domain-containing protein n=1 Tax=Jimgerdemannia flammicorona TaxID=994334 RepID=A0A433QQ12_9FUNG|nr:hypothetical protein BC938DRAFT_476925 [Jimgerdemannia flammicorona]
MARPRTRFDAMLEQLRTYLNDNRLVSLLSKEGELTRENRGKMIKRLVEDAVDEYRRDEDLREIFDGLTDLEQGVVEKKLNGVAMKVVKNHEAVEK